MRVISHLRTAVLALAAACAGATLCAQETRPNILWITSEDNGPHLGCYGDEYATTPHLDALAKRGMIYLNAWSTAPVCAPARTTIISGLYPPSTGSEHMRSMARLPAGMSMYPQYLRAAGYYCTNNSKEDYNLAKPGKVWDESRGTAHWRNRAEGQPFFAIFNITTSHESQVRKRPHTPVHDPAKVRIPAYHPDTPEVRRDWAQYHDKLTEMDAQAGKHLAELEEAGLSDDTIIFYYGDHGPGMPRSKRWPYDSGLRVPLIVSVPEKLARLAPKGYARGGSTDRLVGFIDLAPTLLSIAGLEPPDHFQGHAFMGAHEAPERAYAYGFRGRMDERYDMVRVVRDKRWIYIRNFQPHRIYGQYVSYMFQTPTTRVWKELYDAGELEPPRTLFWEQKPTEELYDLQSDPDEVRNLAGAAEHRATLQRLRVAQRALALEIRDVGFLPEHEIHARSAGSTPYELGHDREKLPLERIVAMAERATDRSERRLAPFAEGLADPDSAVRYWAATGLLVRGEAAAREAAETLRKALADDSPCVRVVAAQTLGQFGDDEAVGEALEALLPLADIERSGVFVAILALNALDDLGGRAAPVRDRVAALPEQAEGVDGRMRTYVPRLLEKILADLGAE